MIARRLSIDPALLVSMFSRSDAWRAVANRLPDDAKVEQVGLANADKIDIWITSSVFRKDDPVDLPAVKFEAVPIGLSISPSSAVQPRKLTVEECRKFEAELQVMMASSHHRDVRICDIDGNPI